jgi:hypothetical protein
LRIAVVPRVRAWRWRVGAVRRGRGGHGRV